jgi:hypothetical protein
MENHTQFLSFQISTALPLLPVSVSALVFLTPVFSADKGLK